MSPRTFRTFLTGSNTGPGTHKLKIFAYFPKEFFCKFLWHPHSDFSNNGPKQGKVGPRHFPSICDGRTSGYGRLWFFGLSDKSVKFVRNFPGPFWRILKTLQNYIGQKNREKCLDLEEIFLKDFASKFVNKFRGIFDILLGGIGGSLTIKVARFERVLFRRKASSMRLPNLAKT